MCPLTQAISKSKYNSDRSSIFYDTIRVLLIACYDLATVHIFTGDTEAMGHHTSVEQFQYTYIYVTHHLLFLICEILIVYFYSNYRNIVM